MSIISLADARQRRHGSLSLPAEAPAAPVGDWRPRVVVVAAGDEWQAAFRVFLWGQPYEIEIIAPPDDWSSISALNPDAVVLDLEFDRVRMLRHAYRLKRSVLGRFVPVVAVEASHDPTALMHAFACGIDHSVAKPMTCDEMRLAVLAALRTRQNYRMLLERI